MPAPVDDVHDQSGPDARPPPYRADVDPVGPGLGEQPLADLVVAGHGQQAHVRAELGQRDGLVVLMALPLLVTAAVSLAATRRGARD
nr:hypothetical protein [Micromonospora thermarum]